MKLYKNDFKGRLFFSDDMCEFKKGKYIPCRFLEDALKSKKNKYHEFVLITEPKSYYREYCEQQGINPHSQDSFVQFLELCTV